jgi:hypothetical protein
MPDKKAVLETVTGTLERPDHLHSRPMTVRPFACFALLLAAGPLPAQTGAFIVRRGADTLVVEQYRRRGNLLEGDQVWRAAPVTTLRHFTAALDRRGGVVRYELAGRPAADPDSRPQTLRVRFDADTATVELALADSSRSERLVVPGGAMVFLSQSYALLELLTRQAAASGQQAYVTPVLSLATLAPAAATVTRLGSDSFTVAIGDAAPLVLRVNAAGDILAGRGRGGAPITVERVAAVDIPALARAFASRPLGAVGP